MDESEDLSQLFQKAADHMKSVAGNLDRERLLYFYARFKQVTRDDAYNLALFTVINGADNFYTKANQGPCTVPKPGFFDFQGKEKWEAWKKLGTKNKKEAMLEYVEMMGNVDHSWEQKVSSGGVKSGAGLGVAVSTLCGGAHDDELSDDQKTVFDWCKEDNCHQVTKILASNKDAISTADHDGLALLHWACDRGHADMVQLLLKQGADINAQDADLQTPLHYAVSCEHIAVVQLLLSNGAKITMADNEGLKPADLAENREIRHLLVSR